MIDAILSLVLRQAPEPQNGQDFWLGFGVFFAAVVLAAITFVYMLETRKMRLATEKMLKASRQPSFALEPSHYITGINEMPGEHFLKLNLVNHGATATDITARCMWLDSEEGGGSSKTFYIISLAKHGYAGLDVPVEKIVSERKYIKVEINCKDASGESYHVFITNGLDKIQGTETKMAYQNSIWFTIYDALNRIARK